jgi:tRNA 2-thiocytidine biosynthesis protein TtcA
VDEPDIAAYAIQQEYPIVCCSCPACGVRDNQQRRAMKEMLEKLEIQHPGLKSSILASMRNVVPTHLMDRSLQSR